MPLRNTPSAISLFGPAFVAAIAYVDPGNVAANISAGAQFGYLLVWVLVAANLLAMFIQYQSAKLGLVTGRSLPEVIATALPRRRRWGFWLQAEVIAAATDLAEVIGGAIALHLLFGLPLLLGGLITGIISTLVLTTQNERHQHLFERIVIGLLLIITVGFLAGLFVAPPDWPGVAGGLLPRLDGAESILLTASMLGATVMPHAIYLHSSLVNHRFPGPDRDLPRLLSATRREICIALPIAGLVNIGLLVLAASALYGVAGTDSIEGAHAAIFEHLSPAIGVIFAIGLLASGLASTSVGSYAGAEIMAGLLHVRIPVLARRLITLVPALAIIAAGLDPSRALVWSQALLSVGIPFAIVPLFWATGSRRIMADHADGPLTRFISWAIAALIIALNITLLLLPAFGG